MTYIRTQGRGAIHHLDGTTGRQRPSRSQNRTKGQHSGSKLTDELGNFGDLPKQITLAFVGKHVDHIGQFLLVRLTLPEQKLVSWLHREGTNEMKFYTI